MAVYLVTGGAGFIGSHLVDQLLSDGHSVRVVDNLSTGKRENLNPRCRLIVGDIGEVQLMRDAFRDVAGCFHLAAIASVQRSNEDLVGCHKVNQTGALRVFDEARRAGGIPVVYASSAAVYGDGGDRPMKEVDFPSPRSAYGADKLGCELHAKAAFVVHRVPAIGVRLFNVYGPRQDPMSSYSGVISIFLAYLRDGAALTIHGDGTQSRDFIYVGDVVSHLRAAMTRLSNHSECAIYNVCTGRPTRIIDLAKTMSEILGSEPRIVFGPSREGDICYSIGDPTAATIALNTSSRWQLEAGLRHLLKSGTA